LKVTEEKNRTRIRIRNPVEQICGSGSVSIRHATGTLRLALLFESLPVSQLFNQVLPWPCLFVKIKYFLPATGTLP